MARLRREWGSVRKIGHRGRWQARYLDPDLNRMIAAPETFASRVGADRWLAAKRADLDRGQVVDDRAGMQALEAWWPGYFAGTVRLRESTRIAYETAWRLRVQPRFGSVPVRRIRASHVEDWLADLHEQGVSSSKAIEAYGVLNRVLARAVRDQALPANPCGQRSLPLPRRPRTHRPVLSPAEVETLAGAMNRPENATLVRLLAYGGLRIGEAFALRCGDLDPVVGTLRIERSAHEIGGVVEIGPTKTYSNRIITMPSSLVTELADLTAGRAREELLFPNRLGGPRRYQAFRRDAWDPAARRAGVAAKPHDLRATCASLLVDAGASVKDVQAQLGHADVTTTLGLYARVRPGRRDDLAERLDQLIAETCNLSRLATPEGQSQG